MSGHAAAGWMSLSVELSSSSADGKHRNDLRDSDQSEERQLIIAFNRTYVGNVFLYE